MDISNQPPFKFIRDFDEYEIAYSKEATKLLGKPHWYTQSAYVYFLGKKFSNRFVFVPKGFFTDGSPTPALLQPLLPVLGPHGAAVFMHARLCETGYALEIDSKGDVRRVKLTREEIDRAFIEALKVIDMEHIKIRMIDLGLSIHRKVVRPKVPNPNIVKDRFQDRFQLDNRIYNIQEEQLYEYLDEDVKFLFKA